MTEVENQERMRKTNHPNLLSKRLVVLSWQGQKCFQGHLRELRVLLDQLLDFSLHHTGTVGDSFDATCRRMLTAS